MIFDQPLSAQQRRKSQHYYYWFGAVNGCSYMCLGETVLILLAVKLNMPDWCISALGAMIYFGFLLLPLGKIFTARWGAARTQNVCWILRNAAALAVAFSPFFFVRGQNWGAWGLLLAGAFFFYGFRAAGVVMSQPLVGEFTTENDRSKVLALSNGIFYGSCFAALISINLLLKLSSSIWMLTLVIVIGAMFGFTASGFLRRIDESSTLRSSARKPLLKEFPALVKNRTLRRQIAAGFCLNLGYIMMAPVSMLALKRGYGVSDNEALLYALVQFAACGLMSLVCGKFAEWFGPRKVLIGAFIAILCIGGVWLAVPEKICFWVMLLPFFLSGGVYVASANAMAHYFLQTIEVEKRVASSIFISLCNGVGAGLTGMFLAGILLKLTAAGATPELLLVRYRIYFFIASLLLLPGCWIIAKLTPLPMEKRKLRHHWHRTV